MLKSILIAIIAISTLSAAHFIPRRGAGKDQVFGTTTVYVGHYKWDTTLVEPLWRYNTATITMTNRYDYPTVTCDAATDTFTALRPNSWVTAAIGHDLPNTTEIVWGTSGTLPAPLVPWTEDKHKRYYIRDSTTTTFKIAATSGGSAIDITDCGSGTHGMSFAGYTSGIRIEGGYTNAFTCNVTTNVCTTASPHGLSVNNIVNVTSTGNLPTGLHDRWAANWAMNCVESVPTSTTFTLKFQQDPEFGTCTSTGSRTPVPVDFTDTGSGTHYLWDNTGNIHLYSWSGFPQGTTYSFRRSGAINYSAVFSSSKPQFAYNAAITMFIKVPAVTAAGNYPITITTSESGASEVNTQTVSYTLVAKTITPISKIGPTADSYTAIPGLSRWEDFLTKSTDGGGTSTGQGGDSKPRCPNPEDPSFTMVFPTNNGIEVWQYDGAEIYYRMAFHFNDPKWNNCGNYITNIVSSYLDGADTQPYFYTMFRGLTRAYYYTRQYNHRLAILRASTGTIQYIEGTLDNTRMREMSGALDRVNARIKITGVYNYTKPDYISVIIGILDEISNGGTISTFNQPFMGGMLIRNLTEEYREHNDERIPIVVKQYLDALWNDWYDPTIKGVWYSSYPEGERCFGENCQAVTDTLGIYDGNVLNGMIFPGFHFIWRLNGNNIYRDRGDELWQYMFGANLLLEPYHAKNWTEMNYWASDAYLWRTNQKRAH